MKSRLFFGENVNKSLIKSNIKRKGWTLCIGAGTSVPIFPSWIDLVKSIIREISPNISNNEIHNILSKYSLDTLIQAAYNLKGSNDFSQWLSEKLYANIRDTIEPSQWNTFRKIFTAVNANTYSDKDWKTFINIRDTIFKETTAYSLAKLIVATYETEYFPHSILSFNAEPLLYALIQSFIREKSLGKKHIGNCPELVNLMTLSIASSSRKRIPYYFCHGALLDWIAYKNDKRFHTDSRLVFLENQYLQMSNNAFSWQSSIFLNACISTIVIFVGISLSDPNVRKWLSWVQAERNKDIDMKVNSTQHFWITKCPNNKATMDWMEASVYHLGVRIIWIKEWSQITDAIKCIIGYE